MQRSIIGAVARVDDRKTEKWRGKGASPEFDYD